MSLRTSEHAAIAVPVALEEIARVPQYATEGAAGADLFAALAEPVVIAPMARALIPTGVRIALPQGYEAQVRPRSGLAIRYGITCLNSPGTIDSDYRGEIKVILINLGEEAFIVEHGQRIAQLVIAPVVRATFVSTKDLEGTFRGSGGFGSTGT